MDNPDDIHGYQEHLDHLWYSLLNNHNGLKRKTVVEVDNNKVWGGGFAEDVLGLRRCVRMSCNNGFGAIYTLGKVIFSFKC